MVINEIMYHPSSENSLEEYIELLNLGPNSVNLNGWSFARGVDFTFPNIDVAAGGYLVVAADTDTLQAKYPGITSVVGPWSGQLSNRA